MAPENARKVGITDANGMPSGAKYVALLKGGKEVRRWELPEAARQSVRGRTREPHTGADGSGAYFNQNVVANISDGKLNAASTEVLLSAPVRAARDRAYAAAIAAGHSPEHAKLAADAAAKQIMLGKGMDAALTAAEATANALADGLHPLIAEHVGARAADLFAKGFSKGAALEGAKAYGKCMASAMPKEAAEAASLAAACACEAAGERDPAIAEALARGEVPPEVAKQAEVSANAAGDAIASGASPQAAAVAGRVAAFAKHKGQSDLACAAAGAASATAIMAGHTEQAAMVSGMAAGDAIEGGASWGEAMAAGAAAAQAFSEGRDLNDALDAGRRAASGVDTFSLQLLDAGEAPIEGLDIALDVGASAVITGDEAQGVDVEVSAYLDQALSSGKLKDLLGAKRTARARADAAKAVQDKGELDAKRRAAEKAAAEKADAENRAASGGGAGGPVYAGAGAAPPPLPRSQSSMDRVRLENAMDALTDAVATDPASVKPAEAKASGEGKRWWWPF